MSTQFPDPAAHRTTLSDEDWEEIGRAYGVGATATELAQRWKVSTASIYGKARRNGWCKTRNADDIARTPQAESAPPRATYFRLDEAAWTEIGEAFRNGATAEALGVRWLVLPGTILRQARRRCWSPKHAKPTVRARATHAAGHVAARPEIAPPEGMMFAPDPRHELERYTAGELIDPGLTAQIAASASCGAMLVGNYQDSLVLAQIAYAHTRIVKLSPSSIREIVWEALREPAACDELFSHTRRDGEEDLKQAYWKWRTAAQQRDAAFRAAQARIRELEAALDATPPPPAPPSQP